MAKQPILLTVTAAAIIAAAVGRGFGSLAGSAHDFSAGFGPSRGETCAPCHAPHNAASSREKLLWNLRITPSVFMPYISQTLKANVGQPDGASKLCLSCHDGTIVQGPMSSLKITGIDLRKVHPISFVYDDALAAAARHLKYPRSAPSGLGGTIAQDLLRGGKMQCVSCHDAHNRDNNDAMLVKQEKFGDKGLCATCHTAPPPGTIEHGRR